MNLSVYKTCSRITYARALLPKDTSVDRASLVSGTFSLKLSLSLSLCSIPFDLIRISRSSNFKFRLNNFAANFYNHLRIEQLLTLKFTSRQPVAPLNRKWNDHFVRNQKKIVSKHFFLFRLFKKRSNWIDFSCNCCYVMTIVVPVRWVFLWNNEKVNHSFFWGVALAHCRHPFKL